MTNYLKGLIMVLISAFGFALMPTFALFAYKSGISVFSLLFIRFFLAAVLFFIYLFIKHEKVILSVKELLMLFFLGAFCYTLQSSLYFAAVKYIPASMAVLIVYTHPVIIACFSSIVGIEPPTKKAIISALVSFFGLSMMLGTSFGNINLFGVLLAGAGSLVYAAYVILSSKMLKTVPPLAAGAYISLSASIGLLFSGIASGTLSLNFGVEAWFWIGGLAVFSTFLALLTFFRGLEILGPTRATIISMAEPLFGVILSVLIFHDYLTPLQIVGGSGVIAGAVTAVYKKEDEKKSLEALN